MEAWSLGNCRSPWDRPTLAAWWFILFNRSEFDYLSWFYWRCYAASWWLTWTIHIRVDGFCWYLIWSYCLPVLQWHVVVCCSWYAVLSLLVDVWWCLMCMTVQQLPEVFCPSLHLFFCCRKWVPVLVLYCHACLPANFLYRSLRFSVTFSCPVAFYACLVKLSMRSLLYFLMLFFFTYLSVAVYFACTFTLAVLVWHT